MKKMFKPKSPEFTASDRMTMVADLDAEARDHERIVNEFLKQKMGGLATSQEVEVEPQDDTSEK